MSKPETDEQYLVEMTKDALRETLGREPTRQEVWKVHGGFKRMAFILIEHIDQERNELRKQQAEGSVPSTGSACPDRPTAGTQASNS